MNNENQISTVQIIKNYLNQVPKNKSKKIIGRGIGSGHGKKSGRGHKGQKARSGHGNKGGFEGGQTQTYKKLPKLGGGFFNQQKNKTYEINAKKHNIASEDKLNYGNLQKRFNVPHYYKKIKIINLDPAIKASLQKQLKIQNMIFYKRYIKKNN